MKIPMQVKNYQRCNPLSPTLILVRINGTDYSIFWISIHFYRTLSVSNSFNLHADNEVDSISSSIDSVGAYSTLFIEINLGICRLLFLFFSVEMFLLFIVYFCTVFYRQRHVILFISPIKHFYYQWCPATEIYLFSASYWPLFIDVSRFSCRFIIHFQLTIVRNSFPFI